MDLWGHLTSETLTGPGSTSYSARRIDPAQVVSAGFPDSGRVTLLVPPAVCRLFSIGALIPLVAAIALCFGFCFPVHLTLPHLIRILVVDSDKYSPLSL